MPIMHRKILRAIVKVVIGLNIALAVFYFFWLYPRHTVPILTYHSFDYTQGMLSVSPENFEKQMRYLKDKKFNVISLDELTEGIKKNKKFARATVVITIDDGYEDNFIYAYPVLKKYNFPAIIFLSTNYIGTSGGFLNWSEVKEMSTHGISFGGHTKSHIYLPSTNEKDVLWDEIAGCKKVIEDNIGASVDYFCYPLGGFTEGTEVLVKKAGYKGACVTNRGDDILNQQDAYGLNRISVRNNDPYFSFSNLIGAIRFRAKLSGYYNAFRKEKNGY
jgi:peptidoglycan/xylan/chitin deacetylase (PgdA/CDA1 family)